MHTSSWLPLSFPVHLQKAMRLEDASEQEMRELKEQLSKVSLDNRSLSSKIFSQKEQSESTLFVGSHSSVSGSDLSSAVPRFGTVESFL